MEATIPRTQLSSLTCARLTAESDEDGLVEWSLGWKICFGSLGPLILRESVWVLSSVWGHHFKREGAEVLKLLKALTHSPGTQAHCFGQSRIQMASPDLRCSSSHGKRQSWSWGSGLSWLPPSSHSTLHLRCKYSACCFVWRVQQYYKWLFLQEIYFSSENKKCKGMKLSNWKHAIK